MVPPLVAVMVWVCVVPVLLLKPVESETTDERSTSVPTPSAEMIVVLKACEVTQNLSNIYSNGLPIF